MAASELDMHGSGPSMGRVGSGLVGSGWVTNFSVLGESGWVGSCVKISNKYTIYTQKKRLFDDYNS